MSQVLEAHGADTEPRTAAAAVPFRAAVRPWMRAWSRRIGPRLAAVPRAADEPRAVVGFVDPDRVLVVGDGVAVGWGVESHDLGLAGHLARGLAGRTERGADVRVRPEPHLSIEHAVARLSDLRIWEFDAIVLTVGLADALDLTPLGQWRSRLSVLLDDILTRANANARVVLVGVQPVRSADIYRGGLGAIADRHAAGLNAASAELAAARDRVRFVELAPQRTGLTDQARHRPVEEYARWGEQLAEVLAPLLDASDARLKPRARHLGEPARQAAVESSGIRTLEVTEDIENLITLARKLFETEGAALNFLDGDRQRTFAAEPALDELPRVDSICDHTVEREGALVVGDARQDPRFADNPIVTTDDNPVRFYAGHPIESPDGVRIGSLCVYDSRPRDPQTVDENLLGELARLAQRGLWPRISA